MTTKMDVHSKAKLLLVDDSASTLAVLSAILKDYHIYTANEGVQALSIASREQPDLILLDIKMPMVDGYEVCRRLKSQADTRDIPIIFVTGLDEDNDISLGFGLGAVDYISKPIRPIVVKSRVATHLQLKANRDRLIKLAHTDGLTGLTNRRHFESIIEKEWNRISRTGATMHLLMIDIDYFKQYNDHYGHAAGDNCLMSVADVLKTHFRRATEISARLGGEEFVGLLTDINHEQAIERAEQVLESIRDQHIPHLASQVANHITISMGLASSVGRSHQSWQALLETADNALYRAKRQGRNRLAADLGDVPIG